MRIGIGALSDGARHVDVILAEAQFLFGDPRFGYRTSVRKNLGADSPMCVLWVAFGLVLG